MRVSRERVESRRGGCMLATIPVLSRGGSIVSESYTFPGSAIMRRTCTVFVTALAAELYMYDAALTPNFVLRVQRKKIQSNGTALSSLDTGTSSLCFVCNFVREEYSCGINPLGRFRFINTTLYRRRRWFYRVYSEYNPACCQHTHPNRIDVDRPNQLNDFA